MKIQKNSLFLAGIIAVSFLLSLTAYSDAPVNEENNRGNYAYLNPFSKKPATPQAHWATAQSLLENGKTSAGRKQLEVFVKRWPNDPKAAAAQKAVGDLYFVQGKNKKAFDAYETLIRKYYTGIRNYDAVLENQLAIADAEMERKRMRWLFGGYTAPERAIPYLESIVRNAPQWARAPEMQYRIGETHQKNENYEMAIVAYTTVEYRYPDNPVAEKASFEKIRCLRELVRETPEVLELREQAQLAAALFQSLYPDSEHHAEVETFGRALSNNSARAMYEIAAFYERVPRPPRNDSARIYYEKVIEQYGGTEYAALAAERLSVLFPGSVTADGELVRPEITAAPEEAAVAGGEALAGLGSGSTNEVAPLPERMSTDTNAVEVTADRMEYIGDLLIADGNVAVQQVGASLRAQHVTVNQETGEIIAIGNVVMLRENNLWEGEKLIYNFKTRTGTFGKSAMYFEPVYIVAEESDRISETELLMKDARITTCSGDDPIIHLKAKEVRIIEKDHEDGGTLIKAKGVTFYVGKVPVFYTPRWQRHLGHRVFSYTVGYGGRWGAIVLAKASLRPTDWLNSGTHLDYYSDRGVGFGQNFFWQVKEETEESVVTNGTGYIETYYINDSEPYDSAKSASEEALINSSRYRVKIGHHHQLNEETDFVTTINYLSDPLILKDFFPEEYRRNANPENYAVVQHATDEYAASLRVDKRLNDFYTTLDRFPELDFDWYRSQIKDSKYYFESESSAAFLEQLHGDDASWSDGGDTNAVSSELPDYNSFRLDTYNKILMPLRVKEFYNVIPRVAYRGTWYGDSEGGSAELRHVFEFGTLATLKAYKTLTEKSGFYGEGMRHIFEPYVDYNYRPEPNVTPDELLQFDEIDSIDKENVIRFGMRNFIQTKRGETEGRIVNFLDADLHTSYRLETSGDEDDFGPLEGDLELSLTDYFNIQSDFEYDWYDSEFQDFNARFNLRTEDMSEYGFEYRFTRDDQTLYTPYARLFPNGKWSYEFYVQYDSQDSKWYERKLIINRKFDCTTLGVGMKVDDDNEATFWFQFWLNAFPGGGLGMAQ